jgi:hypothetical protein
VEVVSVQFSLILQMSLQKTNCVPIAKSKQLMLFRKHRFLLRVIRNKNVENNGIFSYNKCHTFLWFPLGVYRLAERFVFIERSGKNCSGGASEKNEVHSQEDVSLM